MLFEKIPKTIPKIIYLAIKLVLIILAFFILGSTMILYQGF